MFDAFWQWDLQYALASVYGAHVIPHGHGLHAAMHVVASQPMQTCPLAEYLLQFMPPPATGAKKTRPGP